MKRWPWNSFGRARSILALLVAAAAFALVVRVVPFRDRCATPEAPTVVLPREKTASGCILRAPDGPRELSTTACAALKCEPGLVSVFARTRASSLLAVFALYLFGNFAWSVRWFLLVRLGGLRLRLLQVWRVTLEAQAGGILLPGGVAGDALRIGAAIGHGAPAEVVVASVLLDRVIGLTTLAGSAALLGLLVNGFAPGMRSTTVVLGAFPAFLGVALGVIRSAARSSRVQAWLANPTASRLATLLRAPLRYITSEGAPRAIGFAMLASVFVSVAQLVVVRGTLAALGVTPTSEGWVFLGSAMTFMVAAVPVLPGGWGTADAAFVFFLAKAGIEPEWAFAASLLYRSLWYLSGIIGACLQLLRLTGRPTPSREVPGTAR